MENVRQFNEWWQSPLDNFGKSVSRDKFIDEFLDKLYLCGHKENGNYILSLSEATDAAEQIYNEFLK
jgi:hypothetical protein